MSLFLSSLFYLTLAVYHEARGESDTVQQAVAATVINRSHSDCYPDTVKDVVLQPSQFTNIRNTLKVKIDPEAWERAQKNALAAYADPKYDFISFHDKRKHPHHGATRMGDMYFYTRLCK